MTLRSGVACAAVASSSLLTTACPETCDSITSPGPAIWVVDAATSIPICGATVELSEGGRVQSLSVVTEDDGGCDGFIYFERREGSYVATASADGYESAVEMFQVESIGCGDFLVTPSGPRDGRPGFDGIVTIALTRNE